MVRHHRSFKEYKRLKSTPRAFKTRVVYIYGPPGTGKTHYANEQWPNAFWKQENNKWFDDYDDHETVIFDDFNRGWLPYTTLLRIMDAYPCSVETKGGSVNFRPTRLIITSNNWVGYWYDFENAKHMKLKALTRRIDEYIWIDSNHVPHYSYDLEDFVLNNPLAQ